MNIPECLVVPKAAFLMLLIEKTASLVNEFYKKGCQEKKLRLERSRDFFLEIQPTVVSGRLGSWAVCPYSWVLCCWWCAFELERAASQGR